tara:strand:+ start:584 stop:874 length:291 start_codon:yes stop_codon:yes gene_type:complete
MENIILKFEWPYEGHETETLALQEAQDKFPDCFDGSGWAYVMGSEHPLIDLLGVSRSGDVLWNQYTRVTVMRCKFGLTNKSQDSRYYEPMRDAEVN